MVVEVVRFALERIEPEDRPGNQGPDGPGLFNQIGAAGYMGVGTTVFRELRSAGIIEPPRPLRGDGTLEMYRRIDLDKAIRRMKPR